MDSLASANPRPRLLFCSYHSYVDPSSGAAIATRDLLEMMVRRGWPCGVLCGPQLDFESGMSFERLLLGYGLRAQVHRVEAGAEPFSLFHFLQNGVPVSGFQGGGAGGPAHPTQGEGAIFLALLDQVLKRFRPDLLLTYGGNWLAEAIIARAKEHGIPVVFGLHNFAYQGIQLFRPTDAVLVPSRFAQQHYARQLGLSCTALPCVLNPARVLCKDVRPRFVTFVNPQPDKGVFWFARLAHELGRWRPDIPLLVVEGRGTAGWLDRVGLELGGPGNLHVMANTPDPRDFYRVSRALLMPSLWDESFGLVAAESLANGIPVLASRRGALPETLDGAGFLFDVPARYTPRSSLVPTPEEVAPWARTIIRLSDDTAWYEEQRHLCRAAAQRWFPDKVAPQYEQFFRSILSPKAASHQPPATRAAVGPDLQRLPEMAPPLANPLPVVCARPSTS
jgi:glycosyltransferase involved in cell wall biosynthesis